MPTLVQIRATRHRSESDMEVVREARELQRRIDRVVRNPLVGTSYLETMGKRLHHWRREGFPSDLRWFLGDYRDIILSELRFAEARVERIAA